VKAYQWPAIMTGNGGQSAVVSSGTDSALASNSNSATYSHAPVVGFTYDRQASRLLLLYRDPDDGKIVTQIPSRVAVQSYLATQSRPDSSATSQLNVADIGTDSGSPSTGSTTGSGETGTPGTTGVSTAAVSASQGINVVV
jgi:hypothetical protein